MSDLRNQETLLDATPGAGPADEPGALRQEIERLRARLVAAEQLFSFANAVVVADRVDQVYEAAVEAIVRALGTSRAAILLLDADGVMRFRAWRALSDAYRAAVEGHSPWSRDAVAPAPVLVTDVHAEPSLAPYHALFAREGIGALGFIPLVSGGRILGKFMLYYDGPHAFSPHEIELAQAIGHHLASVTARFDAVARLEETIRHNELFAGVLAHDLKNPLSGMVTATQVLMRRCEADGERLTGPLGRILASGDRMARMIDQLLDLTRARVGGGIEVEPREVDLAALCADAIGELELASPSWRIAQVAHGDLRGVWDPDRLVQLVSNLVANAGQHGAPGAPIVVTMDGRDPDDVDLAIRNDGAIPAELLGSLFDPFRRTRERRGHSRGLGLGLFIVREIVAAHDGAVEVSSSEAAGTTVAVRLPRRPTRRTRIARRAEEAGR